MCCTAVAAVREGLPPGQPSSLPIHSPTRSSPRRWKQKTHWSCSCSSGAWLDSPWRPWSTRSLSSGQVRVLLNPLSCFKRSYSCCRSPHTCVSIAHNIPLFLFFLFSPLIPAFSESLKVFQRVLELLAEAQGLLGDSVAPEVWDEHSLTATELASVFNSPPPRCRSTAMRLMSALVHTNTHLSPLRLTYSTYSEGQMVIVQR